MLHYTHPTHLWDSHLVTQAMQEGIRPTARVEGLLSAQTWLMLLSPYFKSCSSCLRLKSLFWSMGLSLSKKRRPEGSNGGSAFF